MANKKQELIAKKMRLEAARKQLKTEFIGLDAVIDEVIGAIDAWYLVPDLQEKPLVVNLWGLTGVGKTSLVQRLVDLLGQDDNHYCLDMGDRDSFWQVRDQLREIHDYSNGAPFIMTLDEFQHLRTLNEDQKEVTSSATRFIWQLLDSGRLRLNEMNINMHHLSSLLTRAEWFLRKGVVVECGQVKTQRRFFMDQSLHVFQHDEEEMKKNLQKMKMPFISARHYYMIYELDRQNIKSEYDVGDKLATMDGHEIVAYLRSLYEQLLMPKVLDCSKALIFVIGNLDEAYTVSHNLDPDISADEFHECCKDINVPKVKKALKKRFRNEEIARLGNNHVIYPAFDSATYRAIIRQDLEAYKKAFREEHKLKVVIDPSIHDLIYLEGVYPTQGTRPVYTTIHQVVRSRTGAVIARYWLKGWTADTFRWYYADGAVRVDILFKDTVLETMVFPQTLKLEHLRKCTHDDHQAVTAVHESGHAICSIILRGIVPETVISATANPGAQGFTLTRTDWKFVARRDIIHHLAVHLGGFAAECVIFGDDRVTTGAGSDIEQATEFVAHMLRQNGMGSIPAAYSVECAPPANDRLFDPEYRINKEMERLLLEGLAKAKAVLKTEQTLLLKMADHLSDHRVLNKEDLIDLCERYGHQFHKDQLIADETRQFYRDFLKQKVAGLPVNQTAREIAQDFSLLNKQTGT